MARIRSLHPGLFTDERYMALSFAARELIKGIWCEADDQGLFEWKPLTLKARIMPADTVDMVALLAELVGGMFITQFNHGGASYGAVRNFRKFQRPKRPNSVHFMPDELRTYVALPDDDAEPGADKPNDVPNISPTDGGKPPQMEDEGGRREEEDVPNLRSGTDARAARSRSSEFEDWWKGYPHKVGKGAAEAKFKIARKLATFEQLTDGVKRYVARKPPDHPWCNPAVWLHQRRWEDEPAYTGADGRKGDDGHDRVTEFWEGFPDQDRVRRDLEWANRLYHWAQKPNGFWSPNWGPRPGRSDCQAPSHMLDWAIRRARATTFNEEAA